MVKDDLLLVDGGLVYVSDGLTPLEKSNAINSLLFCALHARSKFNVFAETQRWNSRHATALLNLRWSCERDRKTGFDQKGGVLVLKKLIGEKTNEFFGVDVAQKFKSLAACADESPSAQKVRDAVRTCAVLQAEEKDSQSSTIVLRMNVLDVDSGISSVLVCFNTTDSVGDDLFNQSFEAVSNVSVELAQYSLDKEAYRKERIRETVLEQLLDAFNNKVVSLGSRPVVDQAVD